jgi:hypothetical protein
MLRRLVLLFALGSELKAQELVSSYHHYSAEGVSAMVHRGFRSAADERAWTIVLAASLPLAQLRPSLHLVGVVSHFLQANSLNDIGFNPRSARWEEQLLLLWSTPNGYHAVGLLHFCKHEIDNADPPDADTPRAGYRPTKRVIILHGPFAATEFKGALPHGVEWAIGLRAALFAIAQDYRIPSSTEESWRRLRANVAVSARAVAVSAPVRIFGQVSYRGAFFESPIRLRHDLRGEAGIRLLATSIELFGYAERIFDDLSRPFPHPSRTYGIGARWQKR